MKSFGINKIINHYRNFDQRRGGGKENKPAKEDYESDSMPDECPHRDAAVVPTISPDSQGTGSSSEDKETSQDQNASQKNGESIYVLRNCNQCNDYSIKRCDKGFCPKKTDALPSQPPTVPSAIINAILKRSAREKKRKRKHKYSERNPGGRQSDACQLCGRQFNCDSQEGFDGVCDYCATKIRGALDNFYEQKVSQGDQDCNGQQQFNVIVLQDENASLIEHLTCALSKNNNDLSRTNSGYSNKQRCDQILEMANERMCRSSQPDANQARRSSSYSRWDGSNRSINRLSCQQRSCSQDKRYDYGSRRNSRHELRAKSSCDLQNCLHKTLPSDVQNDDVCCCDCPRCRKDAQAGLKLSALIAEALEIFINASKAPKKKKARVKAVSDGEGSSKSGSKPASKSGSKAASRNASKAASKVGSGILNSGSKVSSRGISKIASRVSQVSSLGSRTKLRRRSKRLSTKAPTPKKEAMSGSGPCCCHGLGNAFGNLLNRQNAFVLPYDMGVMGSASPAAKPGRSAGDGIGQFGSHIETRPINSRHKRCFECPCDNKNKASNARPAALDIGSPGPLNRFSSSERSVTAYKEPKHSKKGKGRKSGGQVQNQKSKTSTPVFKGLRPIAHYRPGMLNLPIAALKVGNCIGRSVVRTAAGITLHQKPCEFVDVADRLSMHWNRYPSAHNRCRRNFS
ncbi:uncharacterized protein LOC115625340 [Scaptodrosophila lebanonensis]|uniref:Uncharacterized protein LOC115625340 n=1 Tax=Drosophila lebanonensis TaxID=7225 RepID=A0A6J2TM70_DROLE|nr:uncharacterized protein LOC115625340 [Scaptodrosophila lebanonensis]XP_030376237.1 uncharacterized protein LOC115625340 [Scaptodrosophila lebanonensis]